MASAADVLSACADDMRSPLMELHARVAENDAVANDDDDATLKHFTCINSYSHRRANQK